METEILHIGDWTIRARLPGSPGAPALLLLHGWLGNEDVMWVFASKIPQHYAILAPRALYAAGDHQYSWVQNRRSGFSTFDQFAPAVTALDALVDLLAERVNADFSRVHLAGFSQGAALAYSWTAHAPRRVRSLAALAGFLPDGAETRMAPGAWPGLPVFLAHGTEDRIVPIERMRAGAAAVGSAGAALTVCEDAVGHKLSAACLRGLGEFYTEQSQAL